MVHLKIIGGSIVRSSDCESLINGVHCRFENPRDLKEKFSDSSWSKGNWSSFRRFSPDAQLLTLATGLALQDGGIDFTPEQTVGLLVADDFEHESDQAAYFADYLEGGETLGRSSLFVHTLPTSAAADASVCFGLRGPLLYVRDEDDVWGELLNTAHDLIATGNAEIMVLSYRSADTLVCLTFALGGKMALNWPARAKPDVLFEFARQSISGKD